MAHNAISPIPAASGARIQPRFGLGRFALYSLAFLAAGMLALASLGFVYFASRIATGPSVATSFPADGIVVLTGGKARVETAMDLLEDGKARRLLISGVHPDSSSAAIRRAVKGDARLFSCCVDIDKAALDTIGNAEQAAGWAQQNGFDSIIVVTSDYHMPRSLLELRRKLPGVEFRPHPVASVTLSLTDPSALRVLLPEYAKYVAARLGLGVREHSRGNALAATLRN